MRCSACSSTQDDDAAFCTSCGKPMINGDASEGRTGRRPFLYAVLLVPVLIAAAAVGYYKFMLPDGVAAIVNGEEIMRSELDRAVSLVRSRHTAGSPVRSDAAAGSLRYQVLNRMIVECIAAQAAHASGMEISDEEMTQEVAGLRRASGMNEKEFERSAKEQYGSLRSYKRKLERDLLIRRYLREQIIPAGASVQAADAAVSSWFESIARKASVRIDLSEQWTSAGCDHCTGGAGARKDAGTPPGTVEEAAAAGIRYWQERHGGGPVRARTTDFGCHIQVDIVREDGTVLTLRYENGTIREGR